MTSSANRPRAVNVVFLCAFALAAVLCTAPSASAQILYGSIVGTVTDAQGAVMPGVMVSLVNTGTSLKLDTTSDDTGSYVFRNLLPGNYDLAMSL